MSRETAITFATVLLPFALAALAALAAWATRGITRLVSDRRVALALEVLANGAAAIVADLAQHVVSDLKDPLKPGTWSGVAAATVRARAVERVKLLYPQAVALAQEALANPERINDLLGTVVEKAVVDLKGKSALISAETSGGGAATVTVNVGDDEAAHTELRDRETPLDASARPTVLRVSTSPQGHPRVPTDGDSQRGSAGLVSLFVCLVLALIALSSVVGGDG